MKAASPRILVVDDNLDIHADFRKVLDSAKSEPKIANLEAALFGDETHEEAPTFRLDFASQGEDAVEMVRRAVAAKEPYGMAFVDVRMPPGMDGIETISLIRRIDPALDCVICTAYSDYTPETAGQKIGISEGLLFISKPFDPTIIRQLASKMVDRTPTTVGR